MLKKHKDKGDNMQGDTIGAAYAAHVKRSLEEERLIDPGMLSNLIRQISLMSDGYECLGQVHHNLHRGGDLGEPLKQAKSLAQVNGYNPETVQLVPPIHTNSMHGIPCGFFIDNYNFNVYAQRGDSLPTKSKGTDSRALDTTLDMLTEQITSLPLRES